MNFLPSSSEEGKQRTRSGTQTKVRKILDTTLREGLPLRLDPGDLRSWLRRGRSVGPVGMSRVGNATRGATPPNGETFAGH